MQPQTGLRPFSAQKERGFRITTPDVIAHSFDDVKPSIRKVTHRFELISEVPISQKLRRLPTIYNEIAKKEVDRMLQAGIITPVESGWTSPIVLATSKDGSPRF